MGKAPAFQFYVKDWLGDAELQMATSASRGIWINALCFMWEAKDRGKLTGTIEELAKLLGSTNGDFEQFLEDCKRHRFGDVTVRSKFVTLINRRMYKEQKEREITRLRVREFRSKKGCNADVTLPSSSSSSTTNNINRPDSVPEQVWNDFLKIRKAKKSPLTQTLAGVIV